MCLVFLIWSLCSYRQLSSQESVCCRFNNAFPKGGGGEDVDFCINLRCDTREDLISVPQAVVIHPYWRRPLQQVLGWASGDVLCMETLPDLTFWAAPNWAVLALASLVLRRWAWALLAVLLEVCVLAAMHMHAVLGRHGPLGSAACAAVCVLVALPPMVQDVRRLASKLWHLRILQLAQQFDWLDGQQDAQGQRDYVPDTQVVLLFKLLAWALCIFATEVPSARVAVATLLAMFCAAWWAYRQKHAAPLCAAACRNPLALSADAAPFVVLAMPRTGSNMLCGLLHSVAHMHNELFNEKGVFSHCGGVTTDTHTRDSNLETFLQGALAPRADAKPVGFKLFPEHMTRSPELAALSTRVLTDPRIKKVILRRDNQLAVAKSQLRAVTTGAYTERRLDEVGVHMSPAGLQTSIDTTAAYYQWLHDATAGQCVLEVTYERLCEAPLLELARVCAHIGVACPVALPQNIFSPQTSGALRDGVVDWQELRRAFAYSARACDFE